MNKALENKKKELNKAVVAYKKNAVKAYGKTIKGVSKKIQTGSKCIQKYPIKSALILLGGYVASITTAVLVTTGVVTYKVKHKK